MRLTSLFLLFVGLAIAPQNPSRADLFWISGAKTPYITFELVP